MADQMQRQGPLTHIRILDLGRIMAAPWATQIFADLGADVIKIERPGAGDDTRAWGPPFLSDAEGRATKEAGYFLSVNRGKRSVALDIATAEGQAIVRKLAESADVVIENFKVGALAKYGLDAASLRALKPDLIYCSITGFGQDGPRAEQAAYDFAIQAMGGLMSVTGERDDCPGGGPQKVGVPIVDLMTGMYAAVAVLAALARRTESGEGETIDIAMLDVSTAMLANQGMNYLLSGRIPRRGGNRHPNIQPQDVFSSADGDFVLAVGNDLQFAKLCKVLGQAGWAAEARFATNSARVQSNAELTPLLQTAFSSWPRAKLMAALDSAGVPAAPINNVSEVFEDAQVRHRGMVHRLRHPVGGEAPQVVSPMRLADSPLAFERPPPSLGEHTTDVLSAIGIDRDEQAALAQKGVI